MFFFTPSLFIRPKFQTKKMMSNHYSTSVLYCKVEKSIFFVLIGKKFLA
jgi:hypothetical protein